jgi:dTDP-4-amino-4,6-dideoxygalactose transaminase
MAIVEKLALEGGAGVVPEEAHRLWPEVTEEDRQAVLAVLERRQMCGSHAPEISALERDWAEYVGAEYCIATNSGTAALHCCVAGVGVGPGDEVIVPAFSFIATAAAVAHQGGVPVFCDIDERTFNIAPSLVEERITERTRAIMPVHLHGLPADMDALNEIARRYGLAVIEDAAQSHGATYNGRRTGTLGDCAGFSLNATKNLSGGEGGLFVTNDPDVYIAGRRLSIFGEDVSPVARGEFRSYVAHGLGWNYRNQELSSAFVRSQLRRLDHYNETAQQNATVLGDGLAGIKGLTPPYVPAGSTCVFHKFRVQFDAAALGFDGPPVELRDRLVHALRAEGVEATIWQTQPLPAHPAFRKPSYAVWHPNRDGGLARDWDPAEYPVTSLVLNSSLVLGSERYPLFVQEQALMERYIEACRKVVDNIDVLLARPFEPIVLR